MRALLLEGLGAPESLRVGDLPVPEPERGEVRIAVEACGLNPADAKLSSAGNPAWAWPHVLGLDVVGRVDAVGEGVEGVREGELVAYHGDLRRRGGLAEYAVTQAVAVAAVPDSVTPAQAAALPCAAMTAYQAVVQRLHVATGHVVLITAGAGGVGSFAIQLAALAGARVITTASAENADFVRGLGASDVIDYRVENVASRVRELTEGRGVDAVVDTLGAESATQNISLLAFAGGIAAVAGRPDLSVVTPFTTAPSVHEIALGAAYSSGDERARADLSAVLATLLKEVEAGRLKPNVTRTMGLQDVPAALSEILRGHVRGKLVQVVDR